MNKEKINKREDIRYSAFISPLGCSRVEYDNIEVNINNVSTKGIGLTTTERLYENDKIKLEIIMPRDDIPMYIIGEVSWISKNKSFQNVYNAGINIIEIDPEDKHRLLQYIEDNFAS